MHLLNVDSLSNAFGEQVTSLFCVQVNVDIRVHVLVCPDLLAFEVTLIVHVGEKIVSFACLLKHDCEIS